MHLFNFPLRTGWSLSVDRTLQPQSSISSVNKWPLSYVFKRWASSCQAKQLTLTKFSYSLSKYITNLLDFISFKIIPVLVKYTIWLLLCHLIVKYTTWLLFSFYYHLALSSLIPYFRFSSCQPENVWCALLSSELFISTFPTVASHECAGHTHLSQGLQVIATHL